jgi:small conductance mechanosensitive channel
MRIFLMELPNVKWDPTWTTWIITYGTKAVIALISTFIGLWLIRRVTQMFKMTMVKSGIDQSIRPFFLSMINVGLKIFLFITVAGLVGIQTTSIFAVMASAFFAVGLALQGSLSNFASGVMILIFKPYKIGDYIEAADTTGRVEEIQIFNTILLSDLNKRIIVPNSTVLGGIISNNSSKEYIVTEVTVPVKYKYSFDIIKPLLEEAFKKELQMMVMDPEILILRFDGPGYWVGIRLKSTFDFKDELTASCYHLAQKTLMENEIKIGFDRKGDGPVDES